MRKIAAIHENARTHMYILPAHEGVFDSLFFGSNENCVAVADSGVKAIGEEIGLKDWSAVSLPSPKTIEELDDFFSSLNGVNGTERRLINTMVDWLVGWVCVRRVAYSEYSL